MTTHETFEPRQANRKPLAAFMQSAFGVTASAAIDVPSKRLLRSSSFSALHIFVVFVGLLMVAAIPLITQPLPPLEDYVNHLARMQVIATIGLDRNLARFYEIQWQILPNLMMDLVVPPLAKLEFKA